MELILLVVWFLLCFAVAKYANGRGRYGFGYFWLAFFLSPVVAFLILAILPKHEPGVEKQLLSKGAKKCPRCAEFVKSEAVVCRFCQHKF